MENCFSRNFSLQNYNISIFYDQHSTYLSPQTLVWHELTVVDATAVFKFTGICMGKNPLALKKTNKH